MFGRKRTEQRQGDSYTDAIVAARAEAAADAVLTSAVAAEEVCAGLYERAFMAGEFVSSTSRTMLGRRHAGMLGRALCLYGQLVFEARANGAFSADDVVPAETVDVTGGAPELSWQYLLTLPGPSGTVTRRRTAREVWHFRANCTPDAPWRGRSPFDGAQLSRALLQRAETALANELQSAVGHIVTVPAGTAANTLDTIKAALRSLRGRTALFESTAGGWGQGPGAAPQRDWQPTRIGAAPPDALVGLRRDVTTIVMAAAGVPVELATGGDGGSAREAWRRFLHATIQPLGDGVAAEIALKTGMDVRADFDALMASDLSGRARAFQSMVGGGMDVGDAAALAGLMEGD